MFKKNTIAAVMLFALSSGVQAANQGSGSVNFVGSIIDAPCSITPENLDQTVNMGEVSNATLGVAGKGDTQPFQIKLVGCDLETAKSVDVTFKGIADAAGKDKLAIQGSAAGAAIEMVNKSDGTAIELGKATSFANLVDDSNTLKFGATLVSTAEREDIVPGAFTANADFMLTYK
ncbi:fimbria A protein [Serratia sp. S1B]|nr:fimbria A protein [Serratia sp. S1B]